MKKTILSYASLWIAVLIQLIALSANAQKTATISYTSTPPEIDGFIEGTWNSAAPEAIDVNFKSENATIGNSTWQAIFDHNNFYAVVYVEDNNHWPGWEAGGNSWEYDKPEFYWDMNEVLKDGKGSGHSQSGHYMFADGFLDGRYDTKLYKQNGFPGSIYPNCTYAYSLIGEGYVYEIAIPWMYMPDKNLNPVNPTAIGSRAIGFDVTIIDQDKGVTYSRQRKNWSNAGQIDECWNNMDDAGRIYLDSMPTPPTPKLEVSATSRNIAGTSGSFATFTITSNLNWTVVSNQSWLNVSPSFGLNNAVILLTASGNTTTQTRYATVTVSAPGVDSKIIFVTQEVPSILSKSAEIRYTTSPPEIDGFIEEIWDSAAPEAIDVNFKSEIATIGNSTWQALYDDNYFYLLFNVEDDDHWPSWESAGNSWEYDKPEAYWDVNEVLNDGYGSGASNTGHYVFFETFQDGGYDYPHMLEGTWNYPERIFGYSLVGEGYVYEIAVPWASMHDKYGTVISPDVIGNRAIGFDVTIIDQDEGVTTRRQRKNWNNSGVVDECWNNMDGAGTIYLGPSQETPAPILDISVNSLNMSGSNSNATFSITSNIYWRAVSNKSWLTVTPSSGSGDGVLTINATLNPDYSARNAIITISGAGIASKTVMVTQGVYTNQKTAAIKFTGIAPEIDGFIEDTWDLAEPESIDVDYRMERATIGNSTWQGLYDDENFYLVIKVEDDNHWPGWEAAGDSWMFDKPDVYVDVNEVLKDGMGVYVGNTGHYQSADGFTESQYDVLITNTPSPSYPGGTHAYSLVGEGYVYEMAVPWANMHDKTGTIISPEIIGSRPIGFDVSIIDQDEGITTTRHRKNWSNSGVHDECWNNMDDAGLIYLNSIPQPPLPMLEISETVKNISGLEGSTSEISITSNLNWSAVSNKSWLLVTPSSSNNNGILTFTAAENTTINVRIAIVTVSGPGVESKSITIIQEAGDAVLSVSTETVLMPKEGGSSSIGVTSNTSWVASSDKTWLNVNSAVNSGNGVLVLTAETNSTSVDRIANVTVFANDTESKIIVVTQHAGSATLSISSNTVSMTKEGGSSSIGVTSNTSWIASSDKTWLTVNPTDFSGNGELIITADANTTTVERTAVVTVSATAASSKTIVISQQAGLATLSISSNSVVLGAEEGSNFSVEVISNTNWIASSNESWLTIIPDSPVSGDGNLIISVSQNKGVVRTAVVTILSIAGIQTINVSQEAGNTGIRKYDRTKLISLIPNPVKDYFRVSGINEKTTICVSDLNGRLLLSKEIIGNEQIPLYQLRNGIYFVEIKNNKLNVIKKLVKE